MSKYNIGEGFKRFKLVVLMVIALVVFFLGLLMSALMAPLLALALICFGLVLLIYLVIRWILKGFKK